MNDLTVSGAKALARGMIERMAALGVPMTLGQALEGVAAAHHYQDWNRFREALKHSRIPSSQHSSAPFPPHRLIAALPGYGSGPVLEHDFLYEARQPDAFPIMLYFDLPYTGSYFYNVIIPDTGVTAVTALYFDAGETKLSFDRPLPAHGSGIVLNVVGTRDGTPENIFRLSPDEKLLAWKALHPLLPTLLDSRLLAMAGTLYIPDFHHLAREGSDEYDVVLPHLMKMLRSQGGRKSLAVMTQDDDARASLYRSPDDWRLILMAGDDPKLFYRCPFYRVSAYHFRDAAQTYFSRLFADPDRNLEDTALLVGAVTSSHIKVPLTNQTPYGVSVIKYMEDSLIWYKKRREEAAVEIPVQRKTDHRKVL